MRLAIISDLHSNRQAWNAVFTDICSNGVDEIICLGDIVGYGPAPAEVLERAYANVHKFVLGNHDAALCGKVESASFNDESRQTIEWTQTQLDDRARDFFAHLPLVLEGDSFRVTHADFSAPEKFLYMLHAEDAMFSWNVTTEPLLFVGHTHVAGIFVIGHSQLPHFLPPRDFRLEPEKRYVVNAGSVGQPRDGDIRASYVIYDTVLRSVYFRRVPFDVEMYLQELGQHQLPVNPLISFGLQQHKWTMPVREEMDFRPRGITDWRPSSTAHVPALAPLAPDAAKPAAGPPPSPVTETKVAPAPARKKTPPPAAPATRGTKTAKTRRRDRTRDLPFLRGESTISLARPERRPAAPDAAERRRAIILLIVAILVPVFLVSLLILIAFARRH